MKVCQIAPMLTWLIGDIWSILVVYYLYNWFQCSMVSCGRVWQTVWRG